MVALVVLTACTDGSRSTSGTPQASRLPEPVRSVVSSLHLLATPLAAGSVGTVSRTTAVTSARRWLSSVRVWRPTAHLSSGLVRITAFGKEDEPAWLVYASGVLVPWTGQPHIIVVIDAVTGALLGDYVF
jgi:hypothetical protein